MALTKKSKKLIENYISEKIGDPKRKFNKSQLMRRAGYSKGSVSKSIGSIEYGEHYTKIATEILHKTGTVVTSLVNAIDEDVEAGELQNLSFKEKVSVLKTLVQINSSLLPSITKKVTSKSDNGTKESVWAKLN